MREENPIDELFKKELESRAPEFKEEFWSGAEHVLDANRRRINLRRWLQWGGTVVIVAMMAGVAGYFIGVKQASDLLTTERQPDIPEMPAIDSLIQNDIDDGNAISKDELKGNSSSAIDHNGLLNTHKLTHESFTTGREESSDELNSDEKNPAASSVAAGENSSRIAPAHGSGNPTRRHQSSERSARSNETSPEASGYNALALTQEDKTGAASSEQRSGDSRAAQSDQLALSRLAWPSSQLSLDAAAPSMLSFTKQSRPAWKPHRSSGLRSFELSATGAGTLITVPANTSSQWGYEWNAMLQYRTNQLVTGTGIGQFSVRDQVHFTHDSIVTSSVTFPVISYDSLMIIDSILIDSNFFPIYEYDTSYVQITDTIYQTVTTSDTLALNKSAASSGRYLEIPLMIGYRFYAWGLRWQISAGGSYGWYSGALRYTLNEEGHLVSYKPPPVISVMARLYVQYPLTRKFFLQGYAGVRYVLELNSDYHSGDYLIYSAGAGLLYQF